MAAIPVNDLPDAGLDNVNFAAANGGGDTVAIGGRRTGGHDLDLVLLLVRNTDAASKTVTVGSQPARTVPATTGFAVIPVFNEGIGDPSVAVAYSAVTNVTVAAVRHAVG